MSDCFVTIPIDDSTAFSLNTDGTYVLASLPIDALNHESKSLTEEDSWLLQCYSNGHINKVSLNEIDRLRRNYTFSHGIFTGADLLRCGICTDNDFILALFEKAGKKFISIKAVGSLRSHSMLGLKGDSVIKNTFDTILGWYILPHDQTTNIGSIITLCSRNGYVSLDNKEFAEEILWINVNIIKSGDIPQSEPSSNNKMPKNSGDDDNFDFSSLIGKDKEKSLRDKFSSYLKQGRSIPIGQRHVKDVLSLCNNKDDFWRTIICLLECNINIYRSPIVSYFKENPNRLYHPDRESLNIVMKLIFSIEEKVERNIDFLYPFRELLNNDELSVMKNIGGDLSRPEYFHMLGEMLHYTRQDLIRFCLDNASAASYYCIYEVLRKCYRDEGPSYANKLIDSISSRLENGGPKGKLIMRLIDNVFQKERRNADSTVVVKMKYGGFTEYSKLCTSYEEKKKHKDSLDNMMSLVGRKVQVQYQTTYQNHYLLSCCGIRILLPKNMATDKLSENCVTKVFIVMADKANRTLFATQKFPADYKKIMRIPLLNSGDIIEVKFDMHGYPKPHKCYKKIKVSLSSIPKSLDYKKRYQARVIRQTSDIFHYLVKLI